MTKLSRAALACVLVLTAAAPSFACAPPPYVEDFRKHPVQVYAGAAKPVDFASHPVAAALGDADKAKIAKAVQSGANFAGAYRLVYAPCGEKCNALLVVSLATGKIIRVPAADNAFANFRRDSRFLVVRSAGQDARFYLFDGREFTTTQGQQES